VVLVIVIFPSASVNPTVKSPVACPVYGASRSASSLAVRMFVYPDPRISSQLRLPLLPWSSPPAPAGAKPIPRTRIVAPSAMSARLRERFLECVNKAVPPPSSLTASPGEPASSI